MNPDVHAQLVEADKLLAQLASEYFGPIMRTAMGHNTLDELDGFEHYYARRCQEAIEKINAFRASIGTPWQSERSE